MPVIITLPDELAKKLQTEADTRQQSINDCAIDFLERALEHQSFDTQDDFKMLGAQMRATPQRRLGEETMGRGDETTRGGDNDDMSDFEKIGTQISSAGQGGAPAGHDKGATLSSSSASPDKNSNRNGSDTSPAGVSTSFKMLGVQLKGRPSAIASTGWLLDPSVSPINDHKYRIDLEEWSSLWAKVKVKMKVKHEQPPS